MKSSWDSYRLWSKLQWLIIPVWLSGVFLPGMMPFFVLVLIPFIVVVTFKVQLFNCPNCENCFFYQPNFFTFYRPFADKCGYCGHPKWTEPPPKPARKQIYPLPRRNSPPPDPREAGRVKTRNFLTLVLRDDPSAIALKRDVEGWADVDHLIARANRYGIKLDRPALSKVVDDCFEWDQAGNRVRARS